MVSLANFERYNVDFSAGIGFVTGDPAVLNHPNYALAQAYGIDVMQSQYTIKLLYLELGGENWPRQENWMITAQVCEFEGVTTCSESIASGQQPYWDAASAVRSSQIPKDSGFLQQSESSWNYPH